jgi:hypothetical protein
MSTRSIEFRASGMSDAYTRPVPTAEMADFRRKNAAAGRTKESFAPINLYYFDCDS